MIKKIENIYGDEIGYVALLDVMGDGYTPAEDARTSTNKGRLGPEKDAALQERLAKDAHTSPFEGVIAKFEVCAPLFVIRELDRHRTLDKIGEQDLIEISTPEENMRKWFARNEMSGRYIQMPNEYYHPSVVRSQSKTNKQGGAEDASVVSPEIQEEFLARGLKLTAEARELYDWAVQHGIEKGLARNYNTQNQYTKIRYTGSVKNFCDMLFLRLPTFVLWECRVIAQNIELILNDQFPPIMDSWQRNVRDAVRLNSLETAALRNYLELVGAHQHSTIFSPAMQEALKKLKVNS